MREYKYLPLSTISDYEPEMIKEKVSKVARSPEGFLTAYRKARGNPDNLSLFWKKKRDGFIKRHMAQYKKNPTYRRKLALIAWAYMP